MVAVSVQHAHIASALFPTDSTKTLTVGGYNLTFPRTPTHAAQMGISPLEFDRYLTSADSATADKD